VGVKKSNDPQIGQIRQISRKEEPHAKIAKDVKNAKRKFSFACLASFALFA